MKKSAITMLVLSLIFVVITGILLFFASLFVFGSLNALYKPDADLGDAIGGIILYIYLIMWCFGTAISAALILPFDLVLLVKFKIKKWYTIAILAFAIAAIVAAIIMFSAVPIAESIREANSSSSIPSSSAIE